MIKAEKAMPTTAGSSRCGAAVAIEKNTERETLLEQRGQCFK